MTRDSREGGESPGKREGEVQESPWSMVFGDLYLAASILTTGGVSLIGRNARLSRHMRAASELAWKLIAAVLYPTETLHVTNYAGDWRALVHDDNALNGVRVVEGPVAHCNWYRNRDVAFYQARIVAAAHRCRCRHDNRCELLILVDARGERDLRAAAPSRVRLSDSHLRRGRAMFVHEILNTRGFDPATILHSSYRGWATPGRHVGVLRYDCSGHCDAERDGPAAYCFNYNGQPDYADVPLIKLNPGQTLRAYFAHNARFREPPPWTVERECAPNVLLDAAPDEPWLRTPWPIAPLPAPILDRLRRNAWGGGLRPHIRYSPDFLLATVRSS